MPQCLEHVILGNIKLLPQSDQQFSFTEDVYPTMAAVCLTEALGEAHTLGLELMIATQDVQKAFHVVNHSILLQSIYLGGCPLPWWYAITDFYSNVTEYCS